jgi:uncharacterized protein
VLSFIATIRIHLSTSSLSAFAWLALLAGAATSADAASFDCSKAREGVEQAICLDPGVSHQDTEMAKLYVQTLKQSPDLVAVRQSQRDWLRLVRNQCGTISCLTDAYAARIAALSQGTPLKLDASFSGLSAVNTQASGAVHFGVPATAYQSFANWLKEHRVLEIAMSLVRARAPQAVLPNVVAYQCDPNRGAFYLSRENLVVICYQLVEDLANYYGPRSKESSSTSEAEGRRMITALHFAVLHEVGHGLLHRQRAAGSLGAEEVEADNFAAAILLGSRTTTAEVQDSVLSIWGLTTTFGMKESNGWADYGDEHALPQQRFASFACMALGRAPGIGAWLEQASVLPPRRVARCPGEWERAANGLKTLLQTVR